MRWWLSFKTRGRNCIKLHPMRKKMLLILTPSLKSRLKLPVTIILVIWFWLIRGLTSLLCRMWRGMELEILGIIKVFLRLRSKLYKLRRHFCWRNWRWPVRRGSILPWNRRTSFHTNIKWNVYHNYSRKDSWDPNFLRSRSRITPLKLLLGSCRLQK